MPSATTATGKVPALWCKSPQVATCATIDGLALCCLFNTHLLAGPLFPDDQDNPYPNVLCLPALLIHLHNAPPQ